MSKKMQHITLPNGNKYYGHINPSGLPHGMAQRFDNHVHGWAYRGQMRDGMRHGHGTCHFNGGTWYNGEWMEDMPHGKGTGVMVNGLYFDGNMVNGMPFGNVLFQVECVVSGCPQAQLPLAQNQRIIPRSLATQLGRPHGNCNSFLVNFKSLIYDGEGGIDGIGTLSDATAANGPVLHGAFREVGPHLDMVDPDMPHVEIMASEGVLPMEYVLKRHSITKSLKPQVKIKRLEMVRNPRYDVFASDAAAASALTSAVDEVKYDHDIDQFMSDEDQERADAWRDAQRIAAFNARQRNFSSPPDWFHAQHPRQALDAAARRKELINKGRKKSQQPRQALDSAARDELINKGRNKFAKYTQSKQNRDGSSSGGRKTRRNKKRNHKK